MQYKLYAIRKENGLTQADMGKVLEVKPDTYGKKERSEAKFDIDEMFILADYFESNIQDLFIPRK